jgi:S1-C subfamily serine protease
MYVLTAAHCVNDMKTADVQFYSEDTYPDLTKSFPGAEVVARAPDADLALLRFVCRERLPVLPVCQPDQVPTEKAFAAFSVGSYGDKAPTCELREITMTRIVKWTTARKGRLTWQTAQEPAAGRSGGPLIDAKGRLIGVCTGKGDGKGFYVHINEIHAFLKDNGFGRFFEAPKKP